jgi:hypothetical protein
MTYDQDNVTHADLVRPGRCRETTAVISQAG